MMRARPSRNAGFTLFQVLLAVGVSGLLSAGALRASIAQKSDADYASGVKMVIGEVPDYLIRYYYSNGAEYDGIMADPVGILTNQYGARPAMPWGAPWTVVGTDGTPAAFPTRLRMRFNCDQSSVRCNEFLDRVQAEIARNPMILDAELALAGSAIDVVYGTPR